MIYEIDIADAAARFAELIATIDAGYGVLIKRGDEIIARLVPESAFQASNNDPNPALSDEERHAKETFELLQSDIEDSF
jgi:antitoxin (DNA-binding transcriptional repressor) of toxin-antitoxin stability system